MRLIQVLMLCGGMSLLAVGIVSYMTIRMIQNNRLLDSMRIYVDQMTQNTDNAYFDILNIASQMGPNGLIGTVLETYLDANDKYEKYMGQKSLRTELIRLGYINLKLVGANYFDSAKGTPIVRHLTFRDVGKSYIGNPEILQSAGNRIHSIHLSKLSNPQTFVCSAERRDSFGTGNLVDTYVEIEVPTDLTGHSEKKGPYTILQMDEKGLVKFSNNPVIVQGQRLSVGGMDRSSYKVIEREGFKILLYRSKIGYVNGVAVPDNLYKKDVNRWWGKIFFVIIGTFCIFLISVVYLYRLVCIPLNSFRKQMIRIGTGQFDEGRKAFEIEEFDSLMQEIDQMRNQIENLIHGIVEKEKNIQRTSYEKLLYQINPHFLLNTLNSVQWMAQMKKQKEIGDFVQKLKVLLAYNLGKEGAATTLREEIRILEKYVALQQVRYDFIFEINVEEGKYLDQPTVRMLLQPLVENAIRYGLGDEERIRMQVFRDKKRSYTVITIQDSGQGLSEREIREINEPFDYDVESRETENRGIGLRYVKAVLSSFYEGETSLFVNSKKGEGTKITILLPFSTDEGRERGEQK